MRVANAAEISPARVSSPRSRSAPESPIPPAATRRKRDPEDPPRAAWRKRVAQAADLPLLDSEKRWETRRAPLRPRAGEARRPRRREPAGSPLTQAKVRPIARRPAGTPALVPERGFPRGNAAAGASYFLTSREHADIPRSAQIGRAGIVSIPWRTLRRYKLLSAVECWVELVSSGLCMEERRKEYILRQYCARS